MTVLLSLILIDVLINEIPLITFQKPWSCKYFIPAVRTELIAARLFKKRGENCAGENMAAESFSLPITKSVKHADFNAV